jgi:hypothetical protein
MNQMRKSFIYALREMNRRKWRAAGMVMSYFMLAVIVVLVSVASFSTRDATQGALWDIGAHTVAYTPMLTIEVCCVQDYGTDRYDPEREGFVVNNAPSRLIMPGKINMIRQSPNVADAAPYLMFKIRSSLGGGEWILGGIDLNRPVAHDATVVARKNLVEGAFLETGEMKKVMIEQEFAGAYGLAVGSELILGDVSYEVGAIVNPPLRPGKANVYMDLNALRELINTRLDVNAEEPVNAVLVESKGAQFHEAAKADVAEILGQASRISSYGCYKPGAMAMGIGQNTAAGIVFVVIISMLFLAMRIQFASVVQRQKDIGILKALGWYNRNVTGQLMAEAVLSSLTGGLLGVCLSWLIIQLNSGVFKTDSIAMLFVGLLLPLAGGLISGYISSRKAARMQTADILRTI